MSIKHIAIKIVSLMGLLSFMHCGGGAITQIQTTSEEREILAGLGTYTYVALSNQFGAILGNTEEVDVSQTFTCLAQTGTLDVRGSAQAISGGTKPTASFKTTMKPSDCKVSDTNTLLVSGGSLSVEGEFSSAGLITTSPVAFTAKVKGTLKVEGLAAGSGSCTYDTSETYVLDIVAQMTQISVSGTLCGQPISFTRSSP